MKFLQQFEPISLPESYDSFPPAHWGIDAITVPSSRLWRVAGDTGGNPHGGELPTYPVGARLVGGGVCGEVGEAKDSGRAVNDRLGSTNENYGRGVLPPTATCDRMRFCGAPNTYLKANPHRSSIPRMNCRSGSFRFSLLHGGNCWLEIFLAPESPTVPAPWPPCPGPKPARPTTGAAQDVFNMLFDHHHPPFYHTYMHPTAYTFHARHHVWAPKVFQFLLFLPRRTPTPLKPLEDSPPVSISGSSFPQTFRFFLRVSTPPSFSPPFPPFTPTPPPPFPKDPRKIFLLPKSR